MDLPGFSPDRVRPGARAGAAATAWSTLDLPTEKDEIWRYTDVSKLDLSGLSLVDPEIVVDGAELVDEPEGAGLIEPGLDAFTALAMAFGPSRGVSLAPGAPLVRLTVGGGADAARPLALHVNVDDGAEATVVIDHEGDPSLSSAVVEVTIGAGASLTLVDVQSLGPGSTHVANTRVRLARDSRFRSMAVGLGGGLARHRLDADLAEPGAESVMLGLYFGERDQHFDFRTRQEHRAPNCRSETLYKGAVADHARAVYAGLIYVAPGAQKTDGFQTSRNLILSPGAWANAKPELEILANDVRCSHAAAVGPIDEEQLYYLESRGLLPAVARRLIVFGFFEEVLRRSPDPALEAALRLAVAEKFGHVEGVWGAEPTRPGPTPETAR